MAMPIRTTVLSLLALHSRVFFVTVTGFVPTDPWTASAIRRRRGPHCSLFFAAPRYSITTIPSVPNDDTPYRLVIVESPSKCKTIAAILDQYVHDHALDVTYVVTSCMGHVRNLPKSPLKDQPKLSIVGVDIHNGYTPTYVILPGKEGLVKELQQLAEHAQQVVIATDDDREGEAIGWHLQQLLPPSTPQVRVTFGEITKSAIYDSMAHPHSLDMDLVKAQETRRILDRLAGYTVSPVLWKKIAPGLSAGRVQSVGMAMIVQRERERLTHVPVEYWDLQLHLEDNVTATSHTVAGQPVASGTDFDNAGNLISTNKIHLDATKAQRLVEAMMKGTYTVDKIVSKERRQSPPKPFTTSTLQQEGNKKLGLSVSQIMSTAQQLYESGYISYMRTDSTNLSQDAQQATLTSIERTFGSHMVGEGPGEHKKSKNAQEAHEAIRPSIQEDGSFLDPQQMTVTDAELTLYKLIWERTMASSMIPQVVNSTSVDIAAVSVDGATVLNFRVSGSVVVQPGYTLAWGKGSTDVTLPPWIEGQVLNCQTLEAHSHTTQPPPRFNEASFVKALEELGVGRPSTYAGVVQLLRDRAYVGTPVKGDSSGNRRTKVLKGSAIIAQRAAGGEDVVGGGRGPLVPSLSAFVVCSLLEKHCSSYVDPHFTATMEERLDEIARGEEGAERVKYLDEFYAGENGLAAKVLAIEQNVDANEARRANLPNLSANAAKGGDDIGLFIGPWGPYVQNLSKELVDGEKPPTAALPAGMASDLSTITVPTLEALLSSRLKDGFLMGVHPDDGREIRLKIGRYGAFLQWGLTGEDGTTTHSLPKHIGSMRSLDYGSSQDSNVSLDTMIGLTLEDAVGYVGLPRVVCNLNESPIIAAIGPYGPYLKYNSSYVSLNKLDGDVLTIGEEVAIQVVTDGIINKSSKLGRGVLAELGEMNGSMVKIKEGRFGTYISWKKVNAKMPQEYLESPSELPLAEAWALLEERGAGRMAEPKTKKSAGSWDLPPPPKKPKSSYLHFCAEKRPEVVKTETSLGMVSKELARLWAETENDAAARQPYELLAAEEKEVCEERKRQWKEDCQKIMDNLSSPAKKTIGQSNGTKKASKSSNPPSFGKPKRGWSSYLHFCAEKRREVSQKVKSLGEVSKELARLWSETEDRSKYEELAAADAIRYENEKQQFEANGTPTIAVSNGLKKQPLDNSSNENSRKSTLSSMKSAAPPDNKPKRGLSSYLHFCAEKRPEVSQKVKSLGDVSKEMARLWSATEDRSRYEELAAADSNRYEQEMVQFAVGGHVAPIQNGAKKLKLVHANPAKGEKDAQVVVVVAAKRSPSAYMLFCSEYRKTIVDANGEKLPFVETTRRLAELWRDCDPAIKANFNAQAEESRRAQLSIVS